MKTDEIVANEFRKDRLYNDVTKKFEVMNDLEDRYEVSKSDFRLAVREAYRGDISVKSLCRATGLSRQRIRAIVNEIEAKMYLAYNPAVAPVPEPNTITMDDRKREELDKLDLQDPHWRSFAVVFGLIAEEDLPPLNQ